MAGNTIIEIESVDKNVLGSQWSLMKMANGQAFWIWNFRNSHEGQEEFSIPSSKNARVSA